MKKKADQKPRVVFISYSHKDKGFVNKFSSVLSKYELTIWKDSKDIAVGGNIPKNIYNGIKKSSHFCCIISSTSVKSAWVEEELSFAKTRYLGNKNLKIVPVLINKVRIPDYLKAYRCAHLENRRVTLNNPEFTMILKAFGVDLQEDAPDIIMGKPRIKLLERCESLKDKISELQERLETFQRSLNNYRNEGAQSRYKPIRVGGSFRVAYIPPERDYALRRLHSSANECLASLKEVASDVLASIKRVNRAGKEAKLFAFDDSALIYVLSDSFEGKGKNSYRVSRIWTSLVDALSLVEYISTEISNVEGNEISGIWWDTEKLPEWIAKLPGAEAALASAISMLNYWSRFDTDK